MTSPVLWPLWTRRRTLNTLATLSGMAIIGCQPQQTTDQSIETETSTALDLENESVTLNGAGATFPAILYQRWFQQFNQDNPTIFINYQPVGSAAGIQQVIDQTVDFGASDIAMTDEEMAQVDRGVLLVPMTAGSVVVTYNLPGVDSGLKLTRSILADIFLGQITQWNDPQLVEANPDLSLPELDIVVVYRADGSGTTATFTRYLNEISDAWQEQVGTGVAVNWPVGTGAKGNEGVSAQVQLVEGVIGYVEFVYANQLALSVAALENQAGNFITPSPASSALTLSEVELPENLRAFIADPEGENAYPIVTYTWILAYRSYADPTMARALRDVLGWSLTEGQAFSEELGYLPLPDDIASRSLAVIETIGA